MIPLLGNLMTADLEVRAADLATARNLFRNALASNPSAVQCAEILDRLDQRDHLADQSTDPNISVPWMMDLSAWPEEAEEMFDSFCWDNIGQASV
jgi:hypothetical protein